MAAECERRFCSGGRCSKSVCCCPALRACGPSLLPVAQAGLCWEGPMLYMPCSTYGASTEGGVGLSWQSWGKPLMLRTTGLYDQQDFCWLPVQLVACQSQGRAQLCCCAVSNQALTPGQLAGWHRPGSGSSAKANSCGVSFTRPAQDPNVVG